MPSAVRTSAEFANHLAFLLLDLTDPQFQQISRDYATAVEQAIARCWPPPTPPGNSPSTT